jgi:hypothetical protein
MPFDLLKDYFLSFYFKHKGKDNDPWGGANFDARVFILTNLVDNHYKMFNS